jgi:hypothetical protein
VQYRYDKILKSKSKSYKGGTTPHAPTKSGFAAFVFRFPLCGWQAPRNAPRKHGACTAGAKNEKSKHKSQMSLRGAEGNGNVFDICTSADIFIILSTHKEIC